MQMRAVGALIVFALLSGVVIGSEVSELADDATLESASRNPERSALKAVAGLKQRVRGATSPGQVKKIMKDTIRKAVTKEAAQKPKKGAVKKLLKKAAKMEKKVPNRAASKKKSVPSKKLLLAKRQAAEEKFKTAAAERMAAHQKRKAAEENAKATAASAMKAKYKAKKQVAKKVAKKAAAPKAVQAVQAPKSGRYPVHHKSMKEIQSMEAEAYDAAAALKVKEGNALARIVASQARKSGTSLVRKDMRRVSGDKQKLKIERRNLSILVGKAGQALRKAKARPFSKSALTAVVNMRQQVKTAKERVISLANNVKGDVRVKKSDMAKRLPRKATKRVAKLTKKGKKYSLKHPDLKHMTKKQIKYWANKKLKWRSVDRLKKTRIMAKVFAIKQQEATTLTKMNELNTRIGMKTKGVRAKMLRQGKTAIVNGELIKPKAEFHVQSTFQGKKVFNKGRAKLLDPPIRDPRSDKLKQMNNNGIKRKMKSIAKTTAQQLARAKSAATESGKMAHQKHPSTFGLKSMKTAVLKNKSVAPTLGDDDSSDDTSDDGESLLIHKIDQDEAQDAAVDNDADIAMDSLDTTIDASDVDNTAD
jgi:hypothetical protein